MRYIVRGGDNITRIADKFGISVTALLDANPDITNPNLIIPGQHLEIPDSNGQRGFDMVAKFCSPVDKDCGQLVPPGWRIAEGFDAIYPPGYGELSGKHHSGTDIAQNGCYGLPIYAVGGGTVTYAGNPPNDWGWGNIITLALADEAVFCRYAHMSKILCKAGDIVPRGHILGEIGDADGAYMPHLHFDNRTVPYDNPSLASYGSNDWIAFTYKDPHKLYEE